MLTAAEIIVAALQYGPEIVQNIVSVIQKYQAAGTTNVTVAQAAADLDQLDKDIAGFDAA